MTYVLKLNQINMLVLGKHKLVCIVSLETTQELTISFPAMCEKLKVRGRDEEHCWQGW